MIRPIQQNVVFKGVANLNDQGQFTGSMPVARDVRGDYNAAVKNVLNIQQSMMAKNEEYAGKNLNTIA